jgi:hypothetical protein
MLINSLFPCKDKKREARQAKTRQGQQWKLQAQNDYTINLPNRDDDCTLFIYFSFDFHFLQTASCLKDGIFS